MAMGPLAYRPNPLAVAELATSPLLREYVHSRADVVAEGTRAATPVDTGAALDSVRVVETPEGAAVVAGGPSAPYWLYLEYGTEDTPAFAPLQHGLDAAG